MQVSGFCAFISRPHPFDLAQGCSSSLTRQTYGGQGSQRVLWLARFFEPHFIEKIQRDRLPKSGQEPAPDGAARIHVVVPVHATLKTLREALWFEVNPRPCPVKCLPCGILLFIFHRGEAYLTGVRDQRPFQGQHQTTLFRGGCCLNIK